MLAQATLTIELEAITHNACEIVSALAREGVGVVGVTKVTCGDPLVARAMLEGGVGAFGESRLENIQRLRDAGIDTPIWLLRASTPGLADKTVALADVSLESELTSVRALDDAAGRAGTIHRIMVMVDIGDLREGLMPDAVPGFLRDVASLGNIEVVGVGASLTCYGAIVPDARNLGVLSEVARAAEERLGSPLWVSAGSSTSIAPVLGGALSHPIHDLRVGEAIMLGVDPATREPIPGLDLREDALTLSAPVIEASVKPSRPIGTSAQDAFGGVPRFEDRGMRRRALCAVGRQDVPPSGLTPLDEGVEVLGASSDHLVLDVEGMDHVPLVGDALDFRPGYSATLSLCTSPYILKRHLGAGGVLLP
jgi:predicted amino acid racemase